jgi:hypothetical protein
MKVSHSLTTLVDGKGRLIGTAQTSACKLVPVRDEIQILPDLSRAFVINQEQGFLNSNTFGVTLSNGMLAGLNSASTPSLPATFNAALAATAQVAAAAITASAWDTSDGQPPPDVACNAGAQITAIVSISPTVAQVLVPE